MRRKGNPSSFVASCPTPLSHACVPGASPTMLEFLPVVLTGPSTFARVCSVASLPLGHSWG
ncbi:hypothetical protein LEMLEM_LOCUS26244 [Lemmus lemmus]